jgi:phage major head subunit gpT-like protein
MDLTPELVQAAFVGYDTLFQAVFKATPTFWERIATLKESTTEEERYPWMALIPELREWLGERQILNLETRVQSLKNRKFERTFGVKRDKIEDDQLGFYTPSVQELARVAKLWPDKLVAEALIAGDGPSAVVYDNQRFFDSNHPQNMDDANSPLMSNRFTGLPLSDTNLAKVRAAMMSFKTEGNVPMEIVPNLLVVPPQLEYQARKIMSGDTIAVPVGTGGAAPSNVMRGTMDVLSLARLADHPDEYYLMDTTRAVKPLIFQQRVSPEFAYLNKPEDPNVFERDEFLYGVRARGNAGYGPWFLAAKVSQV